METTIPNNIVFGLRAIIEAILAGKTFDKIFIKQGTKGELATELLILAKEREISLKIVPHEKLDSITRKNHQGAIGFIAPVEYQNYEEIITRVFEQGKDPLILILDEITDVRNFGAIARTAECCGVDAIIIPVRGSAPINADAMKTSAGALNKIPVCRSMNLKETIKYLKETGLMIVSCTEKTNENYTQVNLKSPVCIIMGNEEEGISAEYLKLSDFKAKLPMMGTIGSLNVSVACGVILYEALRQRA